jgi:hypothetical protein
MMMMMNFNKQIMGVRSSQHSIVWKRNEYHSAEEVLSCRCGISIE